MIRTQILLTEEQYKELKEFARNHRQSMAEVIRLAIDKLLELRQQPNRAELYQQAQSLVGKYAADFDDIATEHDRYLDKDFPL